MGPLCLDSVRALHQPPERFRVSPSRYPAGASFSESTRAGRRYILSGACSFTAGKSVHELQAGDIADVPEGTYDFRVLGSGPVELVSVWELPFGFWAKTPDSEQSASADGGSM
jgi:quercetin dioxygenase-like cupin family protein